MAWGNKAEDKTTQIQVPSKLIEQSRTAPTKEKKMTDTKQVTVSPSSLEGVTEELKRFSRKLEDLLAVTKATPTVKSGHPAVMAVKRASQDVSFEMKKLRSLLSEAE